MSHDRMLDLFVGWINGLWWFLGFLLLRAYGFG